MSKTLNLTEYSPNFNDPRVRKKAAAVLDWCDSLRLFKRGKIVHHETLTKVFGNRSQGGLAQWLFSNLLTQTGHYQPGKTSFSYRLKEQGYKKVHRLLGSTPKTDEEMAKDVYAPIISGEEAPEYKDSGTRRYHPVQNVKRDIRAKIFAGWWDYDIETCAPTLVHQFVITAKWHTPKSENDFPALTRLIQDKHTVRSEISSLTGLDIQSVKELLSAVFFRGNPAPSHKAGMFRILGRDVVKHLMFLNDPYVKQLRDDVRRLWVKAILYDRFAQANDEFFQAKKVKKRPSRSAKKRMSIYLSLERKVIQVLENAIERQGIPLVLVHDGFMTKDRVDKAELIQVVKDKTGFDVKLSEIHLGSGLIADDEPDVEDVIRGDQGEDDQEES